MITHKPLTVSGPEARKILGIGNTQYWRLVKEGAIKTVVIGRRQMAVYASLEQLVAGGGNEKNAA